MYEVAIKESNFFSEINEFSWKSREGELGGVVEDVKKRNLKRLEMGLYFLHDLGKLVYFGSDKSDGNMAGMVILQPQWLTRCLACIVTQEVKGTYIKEVRKRGNERSSQILKLFQQISHNNKTTGENFAFRFN